MHTNETDERLALTIRDARVSDAPEVVRIEQESFPDPWSADDVRRALTGSQAGGLVACAHGGQITGYCFYWVVADEAEVHSLGVSPQWRRRGIARSILERLCADCVARNVTRILLEVRYTNTAAITLYHGLGFSIDTVRPRYYPDGEDAVLMSRRLGPSVPVGSA